MSRHDLEDPAPVPFIAASGTTAPNDWKNVDPTAGAAPLRLELANDDESRANGAALLQRFHELIRRIKRRGAHDEKSVRDLRRLVDATGTLMLHVPEFLEFMSELLAKGGGTRTCSTNRRRTSAKVKQDRRSSDALTTKPTIEWCRTKAGNMPCPSQTH